MERADLRRRALFAAATVTLAMAGCRGQLPAEDAIPADPGDVADVADVTPAEPPAPVEVTDTAAPGGVFDSGDVGEPGAAPRRPDCSGLDPATCCRRLTRFCSRFAAVGTDRFNTCVYGPNFDGSTGCIPWGPPVPPAFRGAA